MLRTEFPSGAFFTAESRLFIISPQILHTLDIITRYNTDNSDPVSPGPRRGAPVEGSYFKRRRQTAMYDDQNQPMNNDSASGTPGNEPYHWNNPAAESGSYHTAGNGQRETFPTQNPGSAPEQPQDPQSRQQPPQPDAPRQADPDYGKPLYEREHKPFGATGFQNASRYQAPPSGGRPPKKDRRGVKIAAFALVCALGGGLVGGTLGSAAGNTFLRGSTSVQVSDRTVNEVKVMKVDGKNAMTNAENYAANVNSVVSINVGTETNVFGQIVEQASSGSGFVLTQDGYILTNYHVVENATTIEVTTYSGDTYDASYIGGDEDYDIAVIKVDVTGLTPVTIGDSSKVNVGDDVIAIGNPLGELTFSMSSGSVSSANRAITVDSTPFTMIQVDCAINPGNSGGPLFNTYGEVIGIVSAKYSTYANTTVEGLGFAIPINDVYAMVQDIMENGYVTDKAYLGITGSTVTQQLQMQFNLPASSGVFVYSIEPNGAAAKSGLQAGDIITKLGNSEIASMTDLMNAKKSYKAGDTAPMTVNRSGETVSFDFTFGTQPQTDPQAEESSTQNTPQNDNSYYYYYGNPFG